MAKFLSPFILYSLATSCLLLNNIISGLKLEMIHPNSQESSIFLTNISYEESIQRLAFLSDSSCKLLVQEHNGETISSNATIPKPLVDFQGLNYIVTISIGTFKSEPPFKEYYLNMDTSSPFTWMQCQGCTKCFKQKPAPFPNNASASFHLVKDENNNPSTFKLFYGDGSNASGIIARKTLHLNSKNGDIARVLSYVFGCGLMNNMEYGKYKNNRIAGVMGLGWGDFSFATQIKESKGRFSYCLPNFNMFTTKQRPKAYLRLGDDILERRGEASSTKLMRVLGVGSYYVGLKGISINKKRLNISSSLFQGRNGGCIIDSGTPYSHIIEPAYLKLRQGLEDYFSKDKNLNKTSGSGFGLDLCYVRAKPEGFKNLPEITFHFEGSKAEMMIRGEGGFEEMKRFKVYKYAEYFCLAMMPTKMKTIVGAHQQTNQRIVFDTMDRKLLFYPQDCSTNS